MLYVYELSFFAFCHWVNSLRYSSYFDLCGTGFKCVTRFRGSFRGLPADRVSLGGAPKAAICGSHL